MIFTDVRNLHGVDRTAAMLGDLARMARHMPPAWDGARVSQPATFQDGGYFGRVLPGKGLALAGDLKWLGIKKPIPHVYERTKIGRIMDYMQTHVPEMQRRVYYDPRLMKIVRPHPEVLAVKAAAALASIGLTSNDFTPGALLGAITVFSDIVNARANGKANDAVVAKASITTVANSWSAMLRAAGMPAAYTPVNIPGGEAPTRGTVGAFSQGLWDPTAPDKKYLLTVGFSSGSTTFFGILHDLLVSAGNINAAITTSQTINSTAITRNYTPDYGGTPGPGVQMTFIVTTALGTGTGAMVTGGVNYDDQDGNVTAHAGAGIWTSPASAIVERMVPTDLGPFMRLANGDFGVRDVNTFQLSTAHSAGVLCLNLYYPLQYVVGVAGQVYAERDSTAQIDSLAELVTTSGGALGFLNLYLLCQTTSTGAVQLFFRSCAG